MPELPTQLLSSFAMALPGSLQYCLTHKGIEVGALTKIDTHDRSDHLVEECLREACLLQVFMESLVKQSDVVIPSDSEQ